MVISEPTEVYSHDYEFKFTKDKGRVMTTPEQLRVVPLYMNLQGLGWLSRVASCAADHRS